MFRIFTGLSSVVSPMLGARRNRPSFRVYIYVHVCVLDPAGGARAERGVYVKPFVL